MRMSAFSLIDKGLRQLEQAAEVRLPMAETLQRVVSRFLYASFWVQLLSA